MDALFFLDSCSSPPIGSFFCMCLLQFRTLHHCNHPTLCSALAADRTEVLAAEPPSSTLCNLDSPSSGERLPRHCLCGLTSAHTFLSCPRFSLRRTTGLRSRVSVLLDTVLCCYFASPSEHQLLGRKGRGLFSPQELFFLVPCLHVALKREKRDYMESREMLVVMRLWPQKKNT